ncbi:hypothetical protein LTS18_012490, partial [Coniosporium uncinatum]
NDKDVPFALLYAIEEDEVSDASSVSTTGSNSPKQCILKGSLGALEGSAAAPRTLDFQQRQGFMPYFQEAMKSRKPTVVQLADEPIAKELVKDIVWRGFGDASSQLVIAPITPTSSKKTVLGFLVVGLNPRRPYDSDYQDFITVASRLLATCLSSLLMHEEALDKRERTIEQAEAMKAELREQLYISEQEARHHALKFQRFAEKADIGIFIIRASDGEYAYRNASWYNILQPSDRAVALEPAWEELIDESSRLPGQQMFKEVMMEKTHKSMEMKLKRTWIPPCDPNSDSSPYNMWTICSVFPELSESGDVVEFVGSITDITQQKWAQEIQRLRTEDALQSKRQLESFIDTTSHEMRNPLSAVLQCADSILSSHKTHLAQHKDIESAYMSLLESSNEAAQTIIQCSQHMKCIVDDVLTMSKLDSGLLLVTPVDTRPEDVGRHAIKMFEAEAQAAGVELQVRVEDSYRKHGIDWVSLDPTRYALLL